MVPASYKNCVEQFNLKNVHSDSLIVAKVQIWSILFEITIVPNNSKTADKCLSIAFFVFDEQEVGIVCDNIFEVKNYPTTAFVFELAPETNFGSLARLVICISEVLSFNVKKKKPSSMSKCFIWFGEWKKLWLNTNVHFFEEIWNRKFPYINLASS